MTQGVLLIARNNSEVDYVKQAVFSANRIKEFLNLPVSLITDNVDYVKKNYNFNIFDKIIEISNQNDFTYKKYNDGIYTRKSLEFKNSSRSLSYNLTPYDETLLLDTDFIVSNNLFLQCFNQKKDLLLYKDAFDISGWRDMSEFKHISEVGPDFYWATCVFFRKTKANRIFFNLIKHIQENWVHYRNLYQITTSVFRNDHAFSIAIHIMNGHKSGDFAGSMPGTMFFTTDKDEVLNINKDEFLFLVEKENSNKMFPAKIVGSNVHIMNKFSLGRLIDSDN